MDQINQQMFKDSRKNLPSKRKTPEEKEAKRVYNDKKKVYNYRNRIKEIARLKKEIEELKSINQTITTINGFCISILLNSVSAYHQNNQISYHNPINILKHMIDQYFISK